MSSSSSNNSSNIPSTSNCNRQQQQQQNQNQNGSAGASTNSNSSPQQQQQAQNGSMPVPVLGPSSSSPPAVVIQSTAITSGNPLNSGNVNNVRNQLNNLRSIPPGTQQLVLTKYQAFRQALFQAYGQGHVVQHQRIATATLTPYCASVSAPTPASSLILKPEPTCPSPPDWVTFCRKATEEMSHFIKIPVERNTGEYNVINTLVSDIGCVPNVTKIEKVVNPELWKRFANSRRDILSKKSNDLELLKNLKLDGSEVVEREGSSKKFKIDPDLAAVEYSDNIALLFHGTRHRLDDIFTQGLDERLGGCSAGTLLGRGIYFSDDPLKSLQYDVHGVLLIFAVLLGDCMNIDHLANKNVFVREPQKATHQMRNPSDTFFDSVAGRPSLTHPANEFVIYNRNQCCPIYAVTYARPLSGVAQIQRTITDRAHLNSLPSFVWTPKKTQTHNVVTANSCLPWPHFAKTIFDTMKNQMRENPQKEIDSLANECTDIAIKLSLILELGIPGYTDDKINMSLLRKFNFDLEKTIDHILQQVPTSEEHDVQIVYSSIKTNPSTSSSSSTSSQLQARLLLKFQKTGDNWKSVPLNGSTTPIRTPMNEDCLICYQEFPPNPENWTVLKCQHKICKTCHGKITTRRVTMSGVEHLSIKCPFCQTVEGIEIGTCPKGEMKIGQHPTVRCEGYEQFETIVILYIINDGKYKTARKAYLPNSPEGKKVLELLKVAWDRRLCFGIGTSATTGQVDTVIWNLHHKTNVTGGPAKYGYPDPTYLQRVTDELKQFGIE